MELNNGILYVTLGEGKYKYETEYYTYSIDINNGTVGQPTISTGRPSRNSHLSKREYYTTKLYGDDGKTILDSGTLHFCAKDADKTVYMKFEGKNQNLSEYERDFAQGMAIHIMQKCHSTLSTMMAQTKN